MNRIKILLILLFIFSFGYILRVYFLGSNSLTFGYDQARDAYQSLAIANGDLKIYGPPSSTPGLYHGVLYYYLLAPAYLLGHGSPIVAAYWIAFINSLTIFIVFFLTYQFTKKPGMGLVAAFMYAISFESTQYATWLSNPTIAIATVPLMYLGLWLWVSRKNQSVLFPIITGLALGLSVQAEIFLVYHIVPVAIWILVSGKSKKEIAVFGISLLIAVSTMILVQLKVGTQSIIGIRGLAVAQDTNLAYAKSLGDYLLLYLNQIGRIFSFNSYPGNIGYGGGLVIGLAVTALVIWLKQSPRPAVSWQPFLATWLFSHLSVVTVGGSSTPFLMVGIGPAVSIIIGIFLSMWYLSRYRLISILIASVLIFGNLSMIFRENKSGSTLFSIQKDMLLSKQLAAVDYSYHQSGGKPFTINSLTSPLWINIVWTYLYKWYGESEYGYIPSWTGRDQIGQIDGLPQSNLDSNKHFLILEPMGGIPPRYLDEILAQENAQTKIIDEVEYGELRVQERVTKK